METSEWKPFGMYDLMPFVVFNTNQLPSAKLSVDSTEQVTAMLGNLHTCRCRIIGACIYYFR